ncbi:MAG: hypothetical protein IPM13_05515 [Phycisphaerales bacterium]|nr:hypothetical protein [Phycisphaerales bacterium]
MFAETITSTLIAGLLIAAALLAIGLALLVTRRPAAAAANEPRCPECGNDLAGIQGLRCTACGYTAWHASEFYQRRRPAARIVLGVALVVAGLALVALVVLADR